MFKRAIRQRVFSIGHEEVTVRRRGFRVTDDAAKTRLENIGSAFLFGYGQALESGSIPDPSTFHALNAELHGFAWEGSAMAAALMELSWLRARNSLAGTLGKQDLPHVYVMYVGIGWAMARWPLRSQRILDQLDPVLRWLAYDGYGFHDGYFAVTRRPGRRGPWRVGDYRNRAYDQGLGRSLWFTEGANATAITAAVEGFEEERRSDLWSGVGLAAAYAGASGAENLSGLAAGAGKWRSSLGQGVVFASEARVRGGSVPECTEKAAAELCNMNAEEAAALARESLLGVSDAPMCPAFEAWRARIRDVLELAEVSR